MSLKRLLNPTGTEGEQSQSQNLWQDDDAHHVRPRLAEPDQWLLDIGGYNGESSSYLQDVPFSGVFGEQAPMFVDQGGPDRVFFDQPPFLQPLSVNNALSGTSFSSTPAASADDRDQSTDILMTGTDTDDLDLICYGMITHERVKLVGKGQELQEKLARLKESNPRRAPPFRIQHSTKDNQLFLSLPDGTHFGYLSEKMLKGLENLRDLQCFEIEALVPFAEITKAIDRAAKATDAKFRADINVYGLGSDRDQVGKELSRSGLFLQVPDVCRLGIKYDNPHMLRLDGMDETDTEGEEAAEADLDPEEANTSPEQDNGFDETIAEVFGSLQRQEGLNRLEGGEDLSSTLFPHQEEALDFMTQRETGRIPEAYRLWQPKVVDGQQVYCHAITNTEQPGEQDESGGGILADEMGMGKSLTMLVLIGKSMKEAYQWAEYSKSLPDAALAETPCRATLVVVPSRVLINTWVREIESHLKGSMKVLLYHGRSRKETLQNIERYEIVITTYNTLAKEHSAKLFGQGKSPLHEFTWYRIVLDEAHMIRRRETTFHKAVVELSAKSRWCLSGTPIQNSLEDLASLLAFIQVRPLHDRRIFHHWISSPFEVKARKRKAIQHLTKLLEAICLRRTIGRVNLPQPKEETRIVQLTTAEVEQYKNTCSDMRRYIIQKVGEYNERASSFGVFQVYLQLRSLCNHGTYQPRFSWAKPNFPYEEADSVRSLTRDSWDRCSGCRQPLSMGLHNRRQQYIEKCGHILCDECLKGSSGPDQNGGRHCPLCESLRSPHSGNAHDNYLLSDGYSSKMQALVTDVQQNIGTTKSIIFSCWTRTLGLVAKHLRKAKIQFMRIDGKTPPTDRQQILDKFDGTKDVPVLIMTTGTGAFGLNLQSVNRVFIVEPQWNPSVERQAIARAIRLGQEREVLVTRYRVEKSVEEIMYTQQMGKLSLSNMDFAKEMSSAQHEDPLEINEGSSPSAEGDFILHSSYR
ncbi:SNF2 family N-terminal domain-containing protein [Aspergillus varians]